MEYFLIIALGIVVASLWGMSKDTTDQLRNRLDGLESQIDALRAHLVALSKAAAASQTSGQTTVAPAQAAQSAQHAAVQQPAPRPAPMPAPVLQTEPWRPAPSPRPEPELPAAAAQAPAPPTAYAAFSPAAPVKMQPAIPAPVWPPMPRVEPPPTQVRAEPPPSLPPAPPRPATPEPMRAAVKPEPAPATSFFSMEERLGANWLNKLGIAILVIGLAFFLAYKLQTWGPGGKVLCGFAVSVALLAGGVWLERKETYRIFARAGIGGGWALMFFTTFAMHHLPAARVLDSLAADLVLMLLVAGGMVGHSLRYRSQAVTGLAFLLGFGTLLTSDLEATGDTVVFSLTASAVLALALVVVTTLRHWAWLELAGLSAVYINHLVWLTQVLPDNQRAFADFWPSTVLILLYWLIFRLAYVFRTPLNPKEETISSLSAVLNSTGVLGLLRFQAVHPEWAAWALAVLGVAEMALAFRVRSRRRQAFVVLSTIAAVLLVAAVPFRFHGVSWPVLWLVEAQVLALSGLRLGEPVFRRLGLLAGVLTGAVLAVHDVLPLFLFRLDFPDPDRHTSLIVALALAAILYWVHAEVYPKRWPRIAENQNEAFALRVTSWLGVAAGLTALWVALPDLWVPVGWLALMLVLGFLGRRFNAVRLGLQADLLALAAGAVLALHHVLPLVFFRLNEADPSHHPAAAAVLGLAALAYWVHAEVYPRILPWRDPSFAADFGAWAALIEPAASLLGAAMAAAALWVALPDLWVPGGWLALVLVLGFTARRFSAAFLGFEADALALGTGAVLLFHHILPLALLRLEGADPSHHPAETVVLSLAALCYWVHSEAFPRLLAGAGTEPAASSESSAWPGFVLPICSWLGAMSAAAALWVALPAAWVVVGWLALVLVLGLAADWLKAASIAVEADMLAIAALIAFIPWDVWTDGWWNHWAPVGAAVALLYAGMRRRTVPGGLGNYVASAYSWAATVLLAYLAADASPIIYVASAWAVLGLALFEIGRFFRKGFLRWQGFFLVALALGRYLMVDLPDLFGDFAHLRSPALYADHFSLANSLLLEVMVLAAVGYALLERTRDDDRCTRTEHIAGLGADALGSLSIALWFAYEFPSYWVPVPGGEAWVTPIWAGMATALLALAWLMRRRAFLVQAVVLAVAVVARGFMVDLFADAPPGFWHGPLFHLGVAAAILLAGLPFGFRLRGKDFWVGGSIQLPEGIESWMRRPEQWFFFTPFALEVAALAVKLSSGHITIAWSLLGVGVFLFALAVGERSYRLAGLALLMVSVVKILLMDVWKLSPSDRYTTLIVLGVALLAVSFLYTRFAGVIRKLL
jgi:hypothetical protein